MSSISSKIRLCSAHHRCTIISFIGECGQKWQWWNGGMKTMFPMCKTTLSFHLDSVNTCIYVLKSEEDISKMLKLA